MYRDTLLADNGDATEFSQEAAKIGEVLQQESSRQSQDPAQSTFTCPYCYRPFPEKSVLNRRKRGLTRITCDACQISVSLLSSQEQLGENTGSKQVGLVTREPAQQGMQATLRRKLNERAYDVFFCYNHQDQQMVREIGEQLQWHGILPWLEEWDVRPGDPWQRVLEEQIRKAPTAVVFVGAHGIGPWQDSEIYAIHRQMKKRGCRVIPVLLPGTPEHIKLSDIFDGFLDEPLPIDFRVQDPDPIQWLLWGITGKKEHFF